MAITNWKVAVLLVSFQDSTATHRRTMAFYNNMFITKGTGGLVDYWEDISFGKIDLTGSQVFDWKVFPGTVAQFIAATAVSGRGGKVKLAMDLFPTVDFRQFQSVIMVPDGDVKDAGAAGASGTFQLKVGNQTTSYTASLPVVLSNVDILGQTAAHANFFSHEMGHDFGLPHSNGVEEGLGFGWEGPWEYRDPWDVMGGVNPFGAPYTFVTQTFTSNGIGLHAFNLSRLGWLPDGRIKQISLPPAGRAAGTVDDTVTLQPLTAIDTPLGFPAARILFTDVDTGNAQSYWVELRMNTGWDRGATAPALLIRRVIDNMSYIVFADRANNRYGWQRGEVFIDERNNVRISIETLTLTGNPLAVLNVGSFVNLPAALGALGNDIQGAGIALSNLDGVARPELAVMGIENLNGENKGFCRVSLNLSAEGIPAALGPEQVIPNWGHFENQKADIAIIKVDNVVKANAMTFAVFADNPDGHNQAYYRVGLDLQKTGTTTWTAKVAMPRKMANRTVGAAVELVHLDTNVTKPDVVAAFADQPAMGKPWLYYRVGKDMDLAGLVNAWSDPLPLPKAPGYAIAGIGIAVGDLRGTGKKDLLVFVMDKTSGLCKGYYAIGKDIGTDGKVLGGWTDWISVPGTFAADCRDVSISLSRDFTGTANAFSLLIFSVERASAGAPCNGFLRLMKRIKAMNI